MVYLDTNILIRFFTEDNKAQAQKCKKLLSSGKDLCIPDVVWPEIVYILGGLYDISKQKIIEALDFLLAQSNISYSARIEEAVEIYRDNKIDIADAIEIAYVLAGKKDKLATFDKKLGALVKVEGALYKL